MMKQGFVRHLAISEQGGRPYQEDYLMPSPQLAPPLRYALVCDGMGGHAAGDVASRLVGEEANRLMAMLDGADLHPEDAHAIVRQGRERLLRYVREENPFASGLGTTLAAVYHNSAEGRHHLLAFHCGDSRIYHLRGTAILWRSKDHSYVQYLIDEGSIRPEEAQTHRARNILMRSVSIGGEHDTARADVHRIEDVQVGDWILICSDGFYDHIPDADLSTFLGQYPAAEDFFNFLSANAKAQNGDNYSAWLLEWGDLPVS